MHFIKDVEQINNKKTVIYGAGRYGRILYTSLEKSSCDVVGFIQSEAQDAAWNGVEITAAGVYFENISMQEKNSIGICLAIKDEIAKEQILFYLGKIGIPDENIYDCTELIERIMVSFDSGVKASQNYGEEEYRADGRFKLSNFIENINEYKVPMKDYLRDKIKVCILMRVKLFWSSVESICEAFRGDSRFDIIFLLDEVGLAPDNIDNLKSHRYKYKAEDSYNYEKEKPDILLITFHGNDECFFPKCQANLHYFKLVVAITGELITYCRDSDISLRLAGYHYYRPDYYIIDSLLYSYMKEKNLLQSNMIEMGNAKFDSIYKGCKKKAAISDGWGKLKGKKVILWANTHGIYDGIIDYTCTFDLYAKTIFDYAREHPKVAFIVRLHTAFLNEMKSHRFWSAEDFIRLKQYCDESDNLVWDDSDSYNNAFSIADGILTDGFCGIIFSALPLMKPICACYRYDMEIKYGHEEYVKNLYRACSTHELNEYLDMIHSGDDPMYEQRMRAKEKYIHNFDGNNGMRIKEFIEEKFWDKL